MTPVNAFVARSFAADDDEVIRPVLKFLDTFRKVGFFWETAEPAEVESVSGKVRHMIDEREAFIGFFTRRYPVYKVAPTISGAVQLLFGKVKPQIWSAPAWVLQESGYALRGDKELILLREPGVEVFGLQGDLEYIPFDRENPSGVFSKLNEMIHGLLAKAAGTEVIQIVSERRDETQVAIEAVPTDASGQPTQNEASQRNSSIERFVEMSDAAKRRDFDTMHTAWRAGAELIEQGDEWADMLWWDSTYNEFRFEAGASDGLEALKRLRSENPTCIPPILAMARCMEKSGEFEDSAQFFLDASSLQEGEEKARSLVKAAKAYIEIKKYQAGEAAIEQALPLAAGDLREEAIQLHYQLLKESGNTYLAFAAAEHALHQNPQLSLRFGLGLDYHRKNLNELALLHFKFLHDRNDADSGSLHNLALTYSDCKLPITSVKHYKSAVSMGQTLSAANLAFMYLDCGMAEEAKIVVERAMEIEDHVARVEKCLAEIVRRDEEEKQNETALLTEANSRRNLLVKMGRALTTLLPSVEGRWRFPFGEMPLAVMSGKLRGTAEISATPTLIGAVTLGTGSAMPVKTERYTMNGKLSGSVCQFNLAIRDTEDTSAYRSLGGLLSGSKTKSGFIVFEPGGKSATYIELSDGKLGKGETISKVG